MAWFKNAGDLMNENGKKNDEGKPWLALIVPEAEWEEGKALTDGMYKYGKFNFTDGLTVLRMLSGVKRHINLFIKGEDIDPDSKSGAHHLGCARAGLGIVFHMLEHRQDLDDRYKPIKVHCEHDWWWWTAPERKSCIKCGKTEDK